MLNFYNDDPTTSITDHNNNNFIQNESATYDGEALNHQNIHFEHHPQDGGPKIKYQS